MTDATMTAEHDAAETPSVNEADENEALLQTDEGQEDGEQTEGETEGELPEAPPAFSEDEYEDLELEDGKKVKLAKAIKDRLMMQQDYTRKTQELAEQRRQFDSERETFTKSNQEYIAEIGELNVLEKQIGQYSKVDWTKLQEQDHFAAQQHWMTYQQLKDQRNDLSTKIQQQEQSRSQAAERDFANRYAETTQILARDIKDWNETAPKVRDFAVRSGVTKDQLAFIATNPTLSKLLHSAWLGTQVVAKQQQAAEKAKQPVNQVKPKPLTQVGKGGAGAPPKVGLSDDLPTGEWLKRRQQQLSKR